MSFCDLSNNLLTFDNIIDEYKQIPEIVWQNVQVHLQNGLNSNNYKTPITDWVGPTTDLYYNEHISDYENTMAFWYRFEKIEAFYSHIFNFDDRQAAQENMNALPGVTQEKILYSIPSLTQIDCENENCFGGANAGIFSGDNKSGWSSIRIKSTDPNTRYYRGGMYVHEFTHAISVRPFLERADLSDITDWNSRMRSFHPCWIDEGTAHYAGLTVASRNKSEYFTQRINEIKGRQVEGFDPTNTSDVMGQIFNQNFYDCVGTPIYEAGYSVGLVIVETLSAISGPDSILMLWKLGSYGLEFSKAFEYLYGVSWEDAKPIIAEIVAKTSLDNK